MKNRTFQPIHAGVFFALLLTACTGIAQPSLPPASVVINEPTRMNSAEQKNAAPGKTLPQGNGIFLKESKPQSSAVFTKACASKAITCIEISSQATLDQAKVPFTFGQPFKMGDWLHKNSGLIAKDNLGNAVPLQYDQVSSHQDGSARFAVLSAQVENLKPEERRVVSIFSAKAASRAPDFSNVSDSDSDSDWNYRLEAKIYYPQLTRVVFGNRSGHTAGIAFSENEKITLTLSGPATESYTLQLTAEQAGGTHITLPRIAQAFMELINRQSKVYVAEKPGYGGGYENLWLRTKDAEAGSFQVKADYSGKAKIAIADDKNFQKTEIWAAETKSLKKELANATTKNTLRLNGPVVSEINLALPFRNAATGAQHPHLVARLDSRIYHGSGAVWTDAILENNWTFKKDPGNLQYSLSIQENGRQIYYQSSFLHYHHARWHKAFWSGTKSEIEMRHHMPYFMSSAAVWNYDLSIAIPEKVLEQEASLLQKKQAEQQALGPMKNVFLQTAFPGPGGRAEIAPLPRWTAMYLISQDARAYASMMANSDAAAAVPIHYRDEKTDQPVEPMSNPELTVYSEGNVPYSSERTIWFADTAHQGSFTYVPYLLTGDRFYLDEMLFWASWNIISFPVDYRSKKKALVNMQQLRGQAWVLRSLAEADRSLPDSHAMKASFRKILKNNLDWYANHYLNEGKGPPLGFIAADPTQVSPWQNDFLVTVLALMAENKEPHAKELHTWFSRFSVGRFLADDEGFCAARAPGYYWKIADAAGNPFTRWDQIYKENHPEDAEKKCADLAVTAGYPDSPGGYVAYARAMLAASANAGYKDATKAYFKWKSMTPGLEKAFQQDPGWAIAPR